MPRDANQSFRRNYKTDQTVVRIQMTEAPFSYIIGKKWPTEVMKQYVKD